VYDGAAEETSLRVSQIRFARGFLILVVVGGCAATAVGTMDRWLFDVLDPGDFDPARAPPPPDYRTQEAWAALPEMADGADVALPEYPAVDPAEALADVFYVHPTTYVGGEWNARFDAPEVVEATRAGGTTIQASAFNGCCAVHAPRYRQANGRAFTLPSEDGRAARNLAFSDVSTAFDVFVAKIEGRPFIIAGHSQGAVLGARLLRERIVGGPLESQLVAAYLPGAPLREGDIGIPSCTSPRQTGCFVTWHARSPDFEPNGFEFDAARPDTMDGRLCVNPISWTADEARVPASRNGGAVFFDTAQPRVKPEFADAQCDGGILRVTELGDLERDFASRLLLRVMGPGNYHPVEFQLYYLDIRNNATARVEAFLSARPG